MTSAEPRRPTFLARIRRRIKLAVMGVILLLWCVPVVAPQIASLVLPVTTPPVTHSLSAGLTGEHAPEAASELAQPHHGGGLADSPPPPSSPATPISKPKITVVVLGIDLDHQGTRLAIEHLPAEVAIALAPQSKTSAEAFRAARQYGHDTLVDLPVEPPDYPDSDPGANALLTSLPEGAVRDRLAYLLAQVPPESGMIGATASSGGRTGGAFLGNSASRTQMVAFLKTHNLFFVDPADLSVNTAVAPQQASSDPFNVRATRNLGDDPPDPQTLDAALVEVERAAYANDSALFVVRPWPTTLARLKLWLAGLGERGFVLTPLHTFSRDRVAP